MRLEDYLTKERKPLDVETVAQRVQDMSTIPDIAMRVMEVANDPDSNASDLKSIIELDAALSARVLRAVNSAANGLRQKVTNLHQAISYLGLRRIRSLALTASVAELFSQDETIGKYTRRGLWKHLIAVGVCARSLATRQKLPEFEEAFAAGLLHDIGIVLEDQYLHERFAEAIEQSGEDTFPEKERSIIGFDHALLGATIARTWRFPTVVQECIQYHHRPDEYRGPNTKTVHCIALANVICTVKGLPSVGSNRIAIPPSCLQTLSLTREHVLVLSEDLDAELAKNHVLLEL